MKKQIPWKFLPVVLLILFLPAIPAIMMRHNTRETAQAAAVNIHELRQTIVDGVISSGLTQADGECVATVLINYHTPKGVMLLMNEGDTKNLYHPVTDKLLTDCQIERT